MGDPSSGRPIKKKNEDREKKKKEQVEKLQQQKTNAKLGNLDNIAEDEREDGNSDEEDVGSEVDDKYDPLARRKEG